MPVKLPLCLKLPTIFLVSGSIVKTRLLHRTASRRPSGLKATAVGRAGKPTCSPRGERKKAEGNREAKAFHGGTAGKALYGGRQVGGRGDANALFYRGSAKRGNGTNPADLRVRLFTRPRRGD